MVVETLDEEIQIEGGLVVGCGRIILVESREVFFFLWRGIELE
jgi:hypothetical protein